MTGSLLVEEFSTGALFQGWDGFLWGECSACDWRSATAPHWTDPREITTAVDMHHYHAHEVTE